MNTYDFPGYENVRLLGESICARKASVVEAEEYQSNLLENLAKFNDK